MLKIAKSENVDGYLCLSFNSQNEPYTKQWLKLRSAKCLASSGAAIKQFEKKI